VLDCRHDEYVVKRLRIHDVRRRSSLEFSRMWRCARMWRCFCCSANCRFAALQSSSAVCVTSLKWMSPEQIERHVYSKATDVRLACCCSRSLLARHRGQAPTIVVCHKILGGERMTPPKRAPRAMRKLMVECWAHEPKERPRMSSAQKQIAELLNDQSESS
jgi:hypothetical protein